MEMYSFINGGLKAVFALSIINGKNHSSAFRKRCKVMSHTEKKLSVGNVIHFQPASACGTASEFTSGGKALKARKAP